MRAYSLNELFRFTRIELLALRAKLVAELPMLPEPDRTVASASLRKIQSVLIRPRCAPA